MSQVKYENKFSTRARVCDDLEFEYNGMQVMLNPFRLPVLIHLPMEFSTPIRAYKSSHLSSSHEKIGGFYIDFTVTVKKMPCRTLQLSADDSHFYWKRAFKCRTKRRLGLIHDPIETSAPVKKYWNKMHRVWLHIFSSSRLLYPSRFILRSYFNSLSCFLRI
jgi:hypothetical protein